MSRVGILGGTFDPPHNGHIALARAALEALKLDRVIFIPALNPPHKLKKNVASAEDRINMLRLALDNMDHMEISDIELKRKGPSYTVETLAKLHMLFPDTEFFLIIGLDNVAEIETWHKPDEIAKLAMIAAANRPGFKSAGKFSDKVLYFEMPSTNISSTNIRNRLKAGQSIANGVPAKVLDYIEKYRLYQ